MNGIVGVLILMFYVLAGLIRLAWFNVTEECRQDETTENRKCYQGLPITSMSIALPILVVLRPFLHCDFRIALHAFVMDFKLKKPGNKTLSALVGVVAVAVVWTLRRRFM